MRIYRKQYDSNGALIGFFDQQLQGQVPADEGSHFYQEHLYLVENGRALALDDGETLPDGVTETVEHWNQ